MNKSNKFYFWGNNLMDNYILTSYVHVKNDKTFDQPIDVNISAPTSNCVCTEKSHVPY